MRKNNVLIGFVAISALIISGCSSNKQATTSTAADSQNSGAQIQQRDQKRADIVGTVISSVGNELTVNKIIFEDGLQAQVGNEKVAIPTGTSWGNRQFGGRGDFGGPMPGFEGRNQNQNMTEEQRAAQRASRMADLKTEKVTVTIPVGVPVTKRNRGTDGKVSEVTANISDIVKDSSVMIWLDGSGQPERVVIQG